MLPSLLSFALVALSLVDALLIPHLHLVEPGTHVSLARRGINLAARWDGDIDMDVMFMMANCTRVKYNYTDPSYCARDGLSFLKSLPRRQNQGNANLTDFLSAVCRLLKLAVRLIDTNMFCRATMSATMLQSLWAPRKLYLPHWNV